MLYNTESHRVVAAAVAIHTDYINIRLYTPSTWLCIRESTHKHRIQWGFCFKTAATTHTNTHTRARSSFARLRVCCCNCRHCHRYCRCRRGRRRRTSPILCCCHRCHHSCSGTSLCVCECRVTTCCCCCCWGRTQRATVPCLSALPHVNSSRVVRSACASPQKPRGSASIYLHTHKPKRSVYIYGNSVSSSRQQKPFSATTTTATTTVAIVSAQARAWILYGYVRCGVQLRTSK